MRKELTLSLCGNGCHLNCVFCEDDPSNKPQDPEEFMKKLEKLPDSGVSSVFFSGGDATKDPNLPKYVAKATELGIRASLETNGIRLSDEEYLSLLVDSGLSSVVLNTPSHVPEIYNELTGTRLFPKYEAMLENTSNCGLPFSNNVVVTKLNYSFDHFLGLVNFLSRKGLNPISTSFRVMRVPCISPDSAKYLPNYGEAYSELKKAFEFCRENGIHLSGSSQFGLPLCLCDDGDERLFAHDWNKVNKDQRGYILRVFTKPRACHECAVKMFCSGISNHYEDRYEFEPEPFDNIPDSLKDFPAASF